MVHWTNRFLKTAFFWGKNNLTVFPGFKECYCNKLDCICKMCFFVIFFLLVSWYIGIRDAISGYFIQFCKWLTWCNALKYTVRCFKIYHFQLSEKEHQVFNKRLYKDSNSEPLVCREVWFPRLHFYPLLPANISSGFQNS